MATMSPEAIEHARRIFDYLQLNHRALPADMMMVLGTNDTRVADFAAELYHAGLSEKLVVTGGLAHQNDLLATDWDRPEAEVFADILASRGVPRDKMMLETQALNTSENLAFIQAGRRSGRPHAAEHPDCSEAVHATARDGYPRRSLARDACLGRILDGHIRRLLQRYAAGCQDHEYHDGRPTADLGLCIVGFLSSPADPGRGEAGISAIGGTRFHSASH